MWCALNGDQWSTWMNTNTHTHTHLYSFKESKNQHFRRAIALSFFISFFGNLLNLYFMCWIECNEEPKAYGVHLEFYYKNWIWLKFMIMVHNKLKINLKCRRCNDFLVGVCVFLCIKNTWLRVCEIFSNVFYLNAIVSILTGYYTYMCLLRVEYIFMFCWFYFSLFLSLFSNWLPAF